MKPLVSVIVPVYNRAGLITDCVDSVLSQTYKPLELIVIDDGSTDNTCNLLADRYDAEIQLIKEAHTGLPAAARNSGVSRAKGGYIAFCDSDDRWLPDKLEIQVDRMLRLKKNFSCTDAYLDGGRNQLFLGAYKFKYASLNRSLLWENFVITSSVLAERILFDKFRFDESAALRGYEDYDLWLSLFRWLDIDFIREPLLYYRKNESGLSGELRKADTQKQLHLMMKHPFFLRHPFIWTNKLFRYIYHLPS